MSSVEAKNASSEHLEPKHSKVTHAQKKRKPRKRKGIPRGSIITVDELVSILKDKVVLDEMETQGATSLHDGSASVKKGSVETKRKDEFVLDEMETQGGGKSLNCGSAGAKKRSLEIERKSYSVTMDVEVYQNLVELSRHTCTPKCHGYFACGYKAKKAQLRFRELLAQLFGRRTGGNRFFSLETEYFIFDVALSEEEVKILRGHPEVTDIELGDVRELVAW